MALQELMFLASKLHCQACCMNRGNGGCMRILLQDAHMVQPEQPHANQTRDAQGFALVQHQTDVNLLWPLSDLHRA